MRFVIADDDADDQQFIINAVQEVDAAINLTSVYNGVELINLLKTNGATNHTAPDAVILDLNMPLMGGLEALRVIREVDEIKRTPIYILTTSRNGSHENECEKLGVSGLFIKPNSFDALKEIIETIYHTCSAQKESA